MLDPAILINLGGATQHMNLAVEILGITENRDEWLITAEVLNVDALVTPEQMNWFYSDALNRSFVYVPNDYRGGLFELKELVTTTKFDRVRLSVSSVPWAKHGLAPNEYPRIVRCRYVASHVLTDSQNASAEPINLLGEITR